ncbi:MAG TPA: DNA methyltransferase [Methylomirabilota bacterium]|nr:DNA methyltransferase [Methylomirabilota bacterium]
MFLQNLELPFDLAGSTPVIPKAGLRCCADLAADLEDFGEFGAPTRRAITRATTFAGAPVQVPTFINEFWTARQRQASSLHEVSYRACFKPQLPRFFIERLTEPGDRVYDPFMGRGTTLIEAALLGRVPVGCDVNPLSVVLTRGRLRPPRLEAVARRLAEIDFRDHGELWEDLLVFYHPETLKEISALKRYLLARRETGVADAVDDWIALVGLNRLTGHSAGFFSVYTLPPNQAVSIASQRKINEKRGQTPPRREVAKLILRKSKQLLRDCDEAVRATLAGVADAALLLTGPSSSTPGIADNSVSLVVTSPPFLDVVQYAADNWLRCWFLGLDARAIEITAPSKLEVWQEAMTEVLHELRRVLKPGGHVAFEVGEVHGGMTKLEEHVLPCGLAAGLDPLLVMINAQEFTKTANCWGVANMNKGTNTNRIVVFRKP